MKKILLSILCLFSAIAIQAEDVTDVLNRATTGITGTNYAEWSGKTATSDAVYAGQSAGGNESIQLRSKNSNSGIVTTTSGGKIKTITVTWNSNTAVGRTLEVYGKNSAYTSPTELYNNDTKGTLLGTIVNGTSTSLTIEGDYEYIGLRSNNSAMYLTEIQITWNIADTGATLSAPTASVEAGTIYNTTSVELSSESEGTIYYTTDGTEPTAESSVYSEAIAINTFGETTTIKAIVINGEEFSSVASFAYTLGVSAPEFSLESGVYEGIGYKYDSGMLRITTTTKGSKIQYTYTLNGEKTTKRSYGTSASLSIEETTSVKAQGFVVNSGDTIWSQAVTKYYTISPIKPYKATTAIESGKKYLITIGDTITADHLYESSNYGYLPTHKIAADTRTNAAEESCNFIETNEFYGYTITETETAGEYHIQDAYGRYLYMSGSYNNFNVSDDIAEAGDAAVWTITFNENGFATIVNKGKNKTVNYSKQYDSFGSYPTASDDYVLPALYEAYEYPTLQITPADDSTIERFNSITVTCASGLTNNESDELYPSYTWHTDYEYNYDENMFNYGEQVDNTTYTFAPMNEERGNKTYTVTIPEGMFTLDPNGFYAQANEEIRVTFTVEDNSILEVTYANPADEANITTIEHLYFEFSQNVTNNGCEGAVISDANGNTYALTISEKDAWGDNVAANALSLKTATPITAAGTYTFVLSKDYVSTSDGVKLLNDVTYTFTLTEPFKVVSTTPADEATVETLSEITLVFNKQPMFMAESFQVTGTNGESAIFSVDYEAETPENTTRLFTDTPITVAGTYTLFIEEGTICNYNMSTGSVEYIKSHSFTFIVSGTNAIDSVVAEGNGEKVIFDLTGRRIKEINKAGIYIINGVKTIIK